MSQYSEQLKAALADRYAIERELGAGGMATVYLARDLKHDRLVAVKVLDPELAASLGAERFLREIQVTAKLSHPHILPLYDSGAAGGFVYYVMPFVEGESLADKIVREKQLSIKEAVQIAREMAEALAHAHSYGLVHRDIKPQNVLMSGGHAIVADFGIASAVSQAGGEKLTKTGMTVGTPAYMSPEQAMGGDQLDGRADIYSLGCVLFEMLVGQIPFTGTTPQQIIARHSMDHVPPPHIMRDTIPDALEEVILRAMAKLPADRYRTGFEMAEALAAVDTGTAVHRVSPTMQMLARRRRQRRVLIPAGVALGVIALVGVAWAVFRGGGTARLPSGGGLDPRRVAVLYFEDASRDGALAHIADGLTEGLIDELSQVQGLEIVSRDGITPYRSREVPRDSVGRALQAGSLVEGSVESLGDRVSVTARLLEGSSGAVIARTGFELPADQLLQVRDSVIREVAELLRTRLGEEVRLRGGRSGTSSVEAWSLVQRAERLRKEAAALGRENVDAGVAAYQRADSLLQVSEAADAQWATPVALRSQLSYERLQLQRDRQQRLLLLTATVSHASRALQLDPRHAEALALRGRARRTLYAMNVTPNPVERERLLDSAEADLRAATDADGTLASAWAALAQLYYARDKNVDAVIAARNAFEADAFLRNQDANLDLLFWVNYDVERFPDAQQWCQEGARRFPRDDRFAFCQLWLMIAPAATPDLSRAWGLAGAVDTLAPVAQRARQSHLARTIVGGALARAGLADSARHVLAAARAPREVDPEQELPGYEAIMRTILGDYDEAIALLKSYVVSNPTHEFTVGTDLHWWWRPLAGHPGFRDVTERRR